MRDQAPVYEAVTGARASDHSYDAWHLVNGYAAFSHMTKSRPEVIIEGLADGVWVPYEFPCKVGAVDRRPCERIWKQFAFLQCSKRCRNM